MKLHSSLRAIALLTGAALLPLGAVANIPDVPVLSNTITVKYDPATAATPQGASRLYGSLRSAAGHACRDSVARVLVIDPAYAECASGALDEAVKKLNIPAVSALHSQSARR